jgi:hypothetical protein
VEPVIADNGDITFLHDSSHFTHPAPKEFKVRILKG